MRVRGYGVDGLFGRIQHHNQVFTRPIEFAFMPRVPGGFRRVSHPRLALIHCRFQRTTSHNSNARAQSAPHFEAATARRR